MSSYIDLDRATRASQGYNLRSSNLSRNETNSYINFNQNMIRQEPQMSSTLNGGGFVQMPIGRTHDPDRTAQDYNLRSSNLSRNENNSYMNFNQNTIRQEPQMSSTLNGGEFAQMPFGMTHDPDRAAQDYNLRSSNLSRNETNSYMNFNQNTTRQEPQMSSTLNGGEFAQMPIGRTHDPNRDAQDSNLRSSNLSRNETNSYMNFNQSTIRQEPQMLSTENDREFAQTPIGIIPGEYEPRMTGRRHSTRTRRTRCPNPAAGLDNQNYYNTTAESPEGIRIPNSNNIDYFSDVFEQNTAASHQSGGSYKEYRENEPFQYAPRSAQDPNMVNFEGIHNYPYNYVPPSVPEGIFCVYNSNYGQQRPMPYTVEFTPYGIPVVPPPSHPFNCIPVEELHLSQGYPIKNSTWYSEPEHTDIPSSEQKCIIEECHSSDTDSATTEVYQHEKIDEKVIPLNTDSSSQSSGKEGTSQSVVIEELNDSGDEEGATKKPPLSSELQKDNSVAEASYVLYTDSERVCKIVDVKSLVLEEPMHVKVNQQEEPMHVKVNEHEEPMHVKVNEQEEPMHVKVNEQEEPMHVKVNQQEEPMHVKVNQQEEPIHVAVNQQEESPNVGTTRKKLRVKSKKGFKRNYRWTRKNSFEYTGSNASLTLAYKAYREKRYVDCIEVIENSNFPDENKEELRSMWFRAHCFWYQKFYQKPVSAVERLYISENYRPPASIKEETQQQTN